MDYTLATAILFFVLGWILLLLELVVLPGLIAGIVGFVLQLFGVALLWNKFGPTTGLIWGSICTVIDLLMLWWSFRGSSWKVMTLDKTVEGKVAGTAETGVQIGDEGKTSSRLAPAGNAEIRNHFYEVHSLDGFIDVHQPIVVVKVTTDRIFVKAKTNS